MKIDGNLNTCTENLSNGNESPGVTQKLKCLNMPAGGKSDLMTQMLKRKPGDEDVISIPAKKIKAEEDIPGKSSNSRITQFSRNQLFIGNFFCKGTSKVRFQHLSMITPFVGSSIQGK